MEIDSSDDEEGGKEKGDTDDSDSDAETGDKSDHRAPLPVHTS
jgi:hypothetical protein